MKEQPLKDYLKTSGLSQKDMARLIGVHPSAVSQIVMSGRDVRVRVNRAGQAVTVYEYKAIGRPIPKHKLNVVMKSVVDLPCIVPAATASPEAV